MTMRTYTRKRPSPEVHAIEGVMELCRLCLKKPDAAVVSIFSDDPNDVYSSIATRIMMCVGLEISKEEKLPNMICVNCSRELEHCYSFRKMCEIAYQRIKLHLSAIDFKKNKKEAILEEVEDFDKDNVDENMQETDIPHVLDRSLFTVANINENIPSNINITINRNSDFLESNDYQMENAIAVNFNEETDDTNKENTIIINCKDTDKPISSKDSVHSDSTNDDDTVNEQANAVELAGSSGEQQPETEEKNIQSVSLFVLSKLIENNVVLMDKRRVGAVDGTAGVQLLTTDGALVTMKFSSVEQEFCLEDYIKPEEPAVPADESSKDIGSIDFYQDPNMCEVCHKVFSSASVLRRHELTHTGVKPYVCMQCGRAFTQMAILKRHELVHLERRPFQCGGCDKSFTQPGALLAHQRVQHAPRRLALHRCHSCPRTFLHASGLSRHLKMHGGRHFNCEICSRLFLDKSSMRRHLKTVHHISNKEDGNTASKTTES